MKSDQDQILQLRTSMILSLVLLLFLIAPVVIALLNFQFNHTLHLLETYNSDLMKLLEPLGEMEPLNPVITRIEMLNSLILLVSGGFYFALGGLSFLMWRQWKSVKEHAEGMERIHRELEISEHFINTISSNVQQGIIVYDKSYNYRVWNPFMEQLTGLTFKEAIGKNAFELFPHLKEEGIDKLLERALAGETVYSDDTTYRVEKTGKEGWVTGIYSPHHSVDGEIIGVVGIVYDITERKKFENELASAKENLEHVVEERTARLREANEELVALTKIKDRFVSNVSHELRTPITSLRIYHTLLENNRGDADLYIETLHRETDRLDRTIEDLLYLSRLDQDAVQFVAKELDLNILVAEYIRDRQILAENQGLILHLKELSELPTIQADPGLVGQILSILLTNALAYTPDGGKISVGTCYREENGERWAGFEVSDTGPGIPPDEQPQLFSRFFRGSAGRKSEKSGTGLGLAIVKEIVDKHNGHIEVFSTGIPGEGTSFTILLPANGVGAGLSQNGKGAHHNDPTNRSTGETVH